MNRRGMTLVEMLVATAAALVLMAAVAQLFSVFGSAMNDSRATVELDGRLRTVADRLRSDLRGATARPLPPLDPQAGEGYLEIVEGPRNDLSAAPDTNDLAADTDDVLLFTTKNTQTPFIGRAGNALVESSAAEVAWFLRPTAATANPQTFSLFRKQLLVVGVAGFPPFSTMANTGTASSWAAFYEQYDISARAPLSLPGTIAWSGTVTPNTLTDLTRRECRFLHGNINGTPTGSFPFPFAAHQTVSGATGLIFDPSSSSRAGEDVILTNVLSFDVRVFDPASPVKVAADTAVVPGDNGYGAPTGAVASGAYVDLGNNLTTNTALVASDGTPRFAGFGNSKSGLVGTGTTRRTYDTWSTFYETNGIDEDDGGTGTTDEGSDGLDNNPTDGLVDDITEQETSPPYAVPLRGIEIRIRVYEPSSRQVRQVTVRHTFVPH
jgi:prepilin-type N-terminal cleavage/methylation domain-containing protein